MYPVFRGPPRDLILRHEVLEFELGVQPVVGHREDREKRDEENHEDGEFWPPCDRFSERL